MELEPIEDLGNFIAFDQNFYSAIAKVSPNNALLHFINVGRLEGRLVRAFAPVDLVAATGFDPGTYIDIHKDVRDAGVDPWCHFMGHGLREFRATSRLKPPEDEFWAILQLNSWRLLTVHEKMALIEGSDVSKLSTAVSSYLIKRNQFFYKNDIARYIAKASLMLGWPAVAAAFLSSYREALPFSIPDAMAPSERMQVCEAMPLRSYCANYDIFHKILPPSIGGVHRGGADIVVASLPNAVVCPDGSVMSRDHICLIDVSWSGPKPLSCITGTGPRHRVLTFVREMRQVAGTSMPLVRSGALGAFAYIVDALPRLLVGLEAAAPSAVMQPRFSWSRQAALLRESGLLRWATGRANNRWAQSGTITCLVASAHEDIARALLVKAKVDSGVKLLLDTKADAGCRAEALIVTSAPNGHCEDVLRPPFAELFEQLLELFANRTSAILGPGIFLRSNSASVSGIENGDEIDAYLLGFGIKRLVPDWSRADELKAAVSKAQILVAGSAADAAAMIFARAGTPVVLFGLRAREFEAIRCLATAMGSLVCIAGGISTGEELESEAGVALIAQADVRSLLEKLFGGEVLTTLLHQRFANVAAAIRMAPRCKALDILQREAAQLYQASAMVGQFCLSSELDTLCSELGGSEWRAQSADGPKRSCVRVYYASELYRIGGHTRLIEDLIAARPDDEHHIICSAMPDLDLGWGYNLIVRLVSPANVHVVPSELNARLSTVIAVLREIRPTTLFHLAHPYDPVGTAILSNAAAHQLVYVHHNDHSFSLGPSRPGLLHLTVHARSKREVEKLLGIHTIYAPMTSQATGQMVHWEPGAPLLTVSSGSQAKFGSRNELKYIDLLRARLIAREGRHIHIGPLNPDFLHELRRDLDIHGFGGRLVHISFTADLPGLLLTLRPHLYINSYPVGGGRALIDAMAVGLPIGTGHYDANIDSSEVPYPGHLSWTHLGELQQVLRSFSEADCSRHRDLATQRFQSVHAPNHFRRAIDELLAGKTEAMA